VVGFNRDHRRIATAADLNTGMALAALGRADLSVVISARGSLNKGWLLAPTRNNVSRELSTFERKKVAGHHSGFISSALILIADRGQCPRITRPPLRSEEAEDEKGGVLDGLMMAL